MRRIPSASTSHVIYFDAPPGLSGFTVWRSRNGDNPAQYTSPTVTEEDDSNMPGTYSLVVDEDTTIDESNITEHMRLHIAATGWTPGVAIDIELFITDVKRRNGARLYGTGQPSDLWRGVE